MAGELILVVDDGQENRDFIVEHILQPNGFRALVARDGKEGLDMAGRYHPDLILLDYQMPRMNGIEVLKAMIAQNLQIPVVLMTFYGSEEIAVEVFRLGVRDYVKKPFSVDEMYDAIERSLSEVRIRKEKEALTERLIQANRELQLRLQELNVLYSVGKSVAALGDIEQVLPRIVDAAVRITNAEEGYLYLLHKNNLLCQAHKKQKGGKAEAVHYEADDPVALRVTQSGQPVMLTPEQTGRDLSIACAPLVLGGEVIGALSVRNITNGAHVFAKHDSALLSALTDYAAVAIQNARSMDALRTKKDIEKAKIRSTFQRFVPPQVVDQVLDYPELLQLGGKRREVTVMFADLRGYTTYSENSPPEQVIEMLNDYLSLAANVIMSYGGTLDKYIGDGLMAIFNAPNEQNDHLTVAIEAALMLQQAARELSNQRQDGLSFSVGIHAGEAVVGYIGTDSAINYTAVGDVVNLAKRLQEAARAGQILLEESVIQRLGNQISAQALGELKVKGRRQQVKVYELQALVTPQ